MYAVWNSTAETDSLPTLATSPDVVTAFRSPRYGTSETIIPAAKYDDYELQAPISTWSVACA